jgi:signal transduction histidine kinase
VRHSLRTFVRSRLHRRIFVWFGASIFVTGLTVLFATSALGPPGFARAWSDGARAFVADRFERAWDRPAEREALALELARDFDVSVTVVDAGGAPLVAAGRRCDHPPFSTPIVRDGRALGAVELCPVRHPRGSLERLALVLGLAGLVLWGASGVIARRLSRPLAELVRVAGEIGAGRTSSRVRFGCHDRHVAGEVAVLAAAMNDMAERIERQLADQRELLAGVSHEIRTPLARIRLLVELARDGASGPKTLDDLDREVVEIDALVGELLASSRLDFSALSPAELDAVEVARRALERAGVGAEALRAPSERVPLRADPTLLARALSNLLGNAKKHGGGVETLRVEARPGAVAFEVEDGGAGLGPGEEERVFQPFYRRARAADAPAAAEDRGSRGLGLALVKRIAEAHGGRAYAENRAEGGARVGFQIAVGAAAEGEAAA